jgi:cytidine deaminase
MESKIIQTQILVYASISELAEQDRRLLELAHQSVEDAYAPYSNFRVGAAVLLANGKQIGGSNQENAAYPVCICAERVALSAAASQYPREAVTAIAVTAKSQRIRIVEPISPCGTCRQFMCEVEQKHQQDIKVILQGEDGPLYVLDTVRALLPLSFNGSFL